MKPNLRLKHEREVRGWSQARIAQEIGTTDRNVSRWERGASSPSPYFRERLCALFGKSAQELGFVEQEQSASPVVEQQVKASTAFFDPIVPSPSGDNVGLIGRDMLLHQLRLRLCAGKNVALYGLPGVGKTALAVELAHDERVMAAFPDGVLWAGLGPWPNVPGQLSRWGTLLGLSAVEMADVSSTNSTDAWAVALRMAIGKRRMLLVIDDVWKIEAALPFKVGGVNCALLVTTRFPRVALRFAGEGAIAVHELSVDDGLRLLTCLAPEVVAYERSATQTLVEEVGGLPLALTLMGKYLQAQAYDGQPRRMRAAITRLRDGPQRLRLSEPQAPIERSPSLAEDTPLSLQSVIAVSDRLLDEQTRATLRALSVFPPKPNSFSEEAAMFVSQSGVEALDALSDAGLLESSGVGRYTLHQTIADYARANLVETTAGERLIAYMIGYVEKYREDYEALERESSNILAALTQAFVSGQQARLVRGVHAFAPFLIERGLYDFARLHLQRAYHAALWQRDTVAIVETLLHLGYVVFQQGEYGQAEAYLRDGLAGAYEIGHHELAARLLDVLRMVALKQGNDEQAEIYAREQRELRDQL